MKKFFERIYKLTTQGKWLYLAIWTLVIVLPLVYIWFDMPFKQGPPPGERMEKREGNPPPMPPNNLEGIPDFSQSQPPQRPDMGNGEMPPPKPNGMDAPPDMRNGEPPMDFHRIITKVLLTLLMIGGYGGVIYYYRQRQRELEQLKQEKSQSQETPPEPTTLLDDQQDSSPTPASVPEGDSNFIFVKSESRMVRIDIHKIRYAEAMSEYLRLFMEGEAKPVIALLSMKKLEERLPKNFMRVHRSYIVNLQKIQQIERGRIIMDKDTYIPISEGYKESFNQFLSEKAIEK